MRFLNAGLLLTCLIVAGYALAGCSQSAASKPQATATAEHDNGGESGEHDHSGWWCAEHGVPESVCAQCNSKLADEFQKKGDWCKKHDRPDSQCFICHPELEARFAAQYEAKFGKKPPKPEAEDNDQHQSANGDKS